VDAADIETLLLLFWLLRERQRLEAENKELRKLLVAEYEEYVRGTNRLRPYRHPVKD